MSEVLQEEQGVIKLERTFIHIYRNYGLTIAPAIEANKRGYEQVLYLWNGKIGEVGTSNIFFVFQDR